RTRQQLEMARSVLASTRRGRVGESRRGEHLLVLLEGADALLPLLIALAETLEMAPSEPRYHALRAEVQRALSELATDARHIAQALEKEWEGGEPSTWGPERVHQALAALDAGGDVPRLPGPAMPMPRRCCAGCANTPRRSWTWPHGWRRAGRCRRSFRWHRRRGPLPGARC
ncbi:hypothetical protein ACLESO_56950, partial [Pyxidicoccus sp. 3LG]